MCRIVCCAIVRGAPLGSTFTRYYPVDEEIESEPVVNGVDNLTSYDVSPKKIKSKSKLKKMTKKIRQDAEKLQIRALHQWFSRSFVHEGSFPVDSESLKSK